ncbi:serine/threonine protein phosphatase [Prevotella sp. oral taxon 376]|uniref:metallophosphoesterase n=1 Tax=Prevotella sp. oral taxon 376 TaxID=712466 RepID=UPI000D1FB686|nr:metallophosphoesterase [Prevotella sp. oral taxon 376]PTL34212.1 serine/threonine protein phosphatase [Prevotella sp. oral taxon 376]
MIARIIFPIILAIILPEIYFDIYYLRRRYKYRFWRRLLWLLPGILMLVYSVALATIRNFVPDDLKLLNMYLALVGLLVGPKAVFALFSFLGRLWCKMTHSRHNWGNLIGFFACLFGVYVFVYGYTAGFRKLDVNHVDLEFADLPDGFDGYRVVQFSDAHVGTFTGKRKKILLRAVDSINAQKADAIVFTGDIQNIQPSELYPLRGILSSLKAKDGVYSVLGNHDYSAYIKADSAVKVFNEQEIISLERGFGWNLLLNEHRVLYRGKDSLVIAGEENEGVAPHPDKADLRKTLSSVAGGAFVVMLQHDPSAWRRTILPESTVQLTLSGHTHGGQLSLFGFRPTMLMMSEDKGLYEQSGRYLYVNAGLGGVVPFRFGMPSEITVITLHKKK